MATITRKERGPRAPIPARAPLRARRPPEAPRRRRNEKLAYARTCEARARHDLTLALARAERSYALAARGLGEFDEYLSGVRARLRKAGYLAR